MPWANSPGNKFAPMSKKAWRGVLYNDPCAYCGEPSVEIDHVDSIRKVDTPENLIGACRYCNRSKKSQTMLGFLAQQPIGRNHEYRVRGIHFDLAYRDTPEYEADRAARLAA